MAATAHLLSTGDVDFVAGTEAPSSEMIRSKLPETEHTPGKTSSLREDAVSPYSLYLHCEFGVNDQFFPRILCRAVKLKISLATDSANSAIILSDRHCALKGAQDHSNAKNDMISIRSIYLST